MAVFVRADVWDPLAAEPFMAAAFALAEVLLFGE